MVLLWVVRARLDLAYATASADRYCSSLTTLPSVLLPVRLAPTPGHRSWWLRLLMDRSDCIVGEVSSTRLRSKTVGLARNLYNVVGIVSGILNTYMMNPTAWVRTFTHSLSIMGVFRDTLHDRHVAWDGACR